MLFQIISGLWYLCSTYKFRYLLRCIKGKRNSDFISIVGHFLLPPNLFGKEPRELLHYAIECENLIIAHYLISIGCELDATDADRKSTSILFANLMKKEDFNVNDHLQLTGFTFPSHFFMVKRLLDNLTRGCSNKKEMAERLVKYHCPLVAAVGVYKSAELTKLMLNCGCPIDDRLVSTGETSLHLAVKNLDIWNVRLLVQHNAEIDALDNENRTPLSRFKMNSHDPDEKLEILTFLLDSGASLSKPCFKNGFFHNIYHLLQPIPSVASELFSAEDNRTLQTLISSVDIFKIDENGRSPFDYLLHNRTALDISKQMRQIESTPDKNQLTAQNTIEHEGYPVRSGLIFVTVGENQLYSEDIDIYLGMKYLMLDKPEVNEAVMMITDIYLDDPKLYNRHIDKAIFYISPIKTLVDYYERLIAHLVHLESFGTPLDEMIVEEIQLNIMLQSHFNWCKNQIDEMKVNTVFKDITLHKLLSMHQKRRIKYVRNREFRSSYDLQKNKMKKICPSYANVIAYRFDEAISVVEMEIQADYVIQKITGMPATVSYAILHYLKQKDFQNLCTLKMK